MLKEVVVGLFVGVLLAVVVAAGVAKRVGLDVACSTINVTWVLAAAFGTLLQMLYTMPVLAVVLVNSGQLS